MAACLRDPQPKELNHKRETLKLKPLRGSHSASGISTKLGSQAQPRLRFRCFKYLPFRCQYNPIRV